MAKYGSQGNHLWSSSFGGSDGTAGTSRDVGNAIAVDSVGNVLLSGLFQNGVDFGGGSINAAGEDAFLAKYDAAGVHLWSKGLGWTGGDEGLGLAVDGTGSVVVTGAFESSVDFGGGLLSSFGGQDGFVAKYGP